MSSWLQSNIFRLSRPKSKTNGTEILKDSKEVAKSDIENTQIDSGPITAINDPPPLSDPKTAPSRENLTVETRRADPEKFNPKSASISSSFDFKEDDIEDKPELSKSQKSATLTSLSRSDTRPVKSPSKDKNSRFFKSKSLSNPLQSAALLPIENRNGKASDANGISNNSDSITHQKSVDFIETTKTTNITKKKSFLLSHFSLNKDGSESNNNTNNANQPILSSPSKSIDSNDRKFTTRSVSNVSDKSSMSNSPSQHKPYYKSNASVLGHQNSKDSDSNVSRSQKDTNSNTDNKSVVTRVLGFTNSKSRSSSSDQPTTSSVMNEKNTFYIVHQNYKDNDYAEAIASMPNIPDDMKIHIQANRYVRTRINNII